MSKKEIPRFRSEEEEQEFWSKHDSTDYVDWGQALRMILPNLKPLTKAHDRR